MLDYQKKTHADFNRGQAVTLMADGHPIGPEMIVLRSWGRTVGPDGHIYQPAVACKWHDSAGRPQSDSYPPNALCPLDELEYYKDPDDQVQMLQLQIGEACGLLGPGGDDTLKGRVESVLAELDTAKKTLASLRVIFSRRSLQHTPLTEEKLGQIWELLGI